VLIELARVSRQIRLRASSSSGSGQE